MPHFEKIIDEVFEKQSLIDLFWKETDLLLCIAGASDGKFHYVNDQWCELLGYSHKELTSVPFQTFVHPDDLNKTLDVYNGSEGELDYIFVNRYRDEQGNYKVIKWITSVLSSDGKYHFSIATSDRN